VETEFIEAEMVSFENTSYWNVCRFRSYPREECTLLRESLEEKMDCKGTTPCWMIRVLTTCQGSGRA
jgi:hypothetical protein